MAMQGIDTEWRSEAMINNTKGLHGDLVFQSEYAWLSNFYPALWNCKVLSQWAQSSLKCFKSTLKALQGIVGTV